MSPSAFILGVREDHSSRGAAACRECKGLDTSSPDPLWGLRCPLPSHVGGGACYPSLHLGYDTAFLPLPGLRNGLQTTVCGQGQGSSKPGPSPGHCLDFRWRGPIRDLPDNRLSEGEPSLHKHSARRVRRSSSCPNTRLDGSRVGFPYITEEDRRDPFREQDSRVLRLLRHAARPALQVLHELWLKNSVVPSSPL